MPNHGHLREAWGSSITGRNSIAIKAPLDLAILFPACLYMPGRDADFSRYGVDDLLSYALGAA